MNTPPLLMGAALLFWGWQTDTLVWGAAMAAVLEASRIVGHRWDLTQRDFYRIADLCALIFLAMAVYRFTAQTASMARWLPTAMFPLLAAQAYSSVARVDLGAIFYTVRQREKRSPGAPRRGVDIAYPAVALILLAASAANLRTPAFYAGLAAITAWGLWPHRPRHATTGYVALMAAAVLGGYFGGTALHRTQQRLEAYIVDRYPPARSARRNVTALGDIGRLKQYGRIIMRVRPVGAFRPGLRLHEASFNRFTGNAWVASHTRFRPVPPRALSVPAWTLAEAASGGALAEIVYPLENGRGVLPLPEGTTGLDGIVADLLEQSPYGAVRVSGAPPLARYRAAYRTAAGVNQSPPGADDLTIPTAEAAAVRNALAATALEEASPAEIADGIRRLFQDGFRYSLDLTPPPTGRTALSHFLMDTRAGHCEYFATATVLMLRAAGIPARYASGYAVTEYSRLESAFVVRARHAHAWALAHIGGRWRPVDTTPADWAQIEAEGRSILSPVADVFRWAHFRLSAWRRSLAASSRLKWLAWLILPAVLVAWRWVRRRRPAMRTPAPADGPALAAAHGGPAPLRPIETIMAECGWPRPAWEPHGAWARRVAAAGCDPETARRLIRLVSRYDRYRFGPGMPPADTAALHRDIRELARHLHQCPPGPPQPA